MSYDYHVTVNVVILYFSLYSHVMKTMSQCQRIICHTSVIAMINRLIPD